MDSQKKAEPHPSQNSQGQPRVQRGKKSANKKRLNLWRLLWAFLALLIVGFAAAGGALAGYSSAQAERQIAQAVQAALSIQEQYELGVQDLEAGRYEIARQRFEYVLKEDPNFPGATDRMLEVVAVLYATATPTVPPPTQTPTPTRDLRPVQDLFSQLQTHFGNGDWDATVQAANALRSNDPQYRVTDVDRMLFISLRNRGVERILRSNDLGGGSYDLALAERFGPLDVKANQALNLARLYLYGSSFWEAIPERAIYYFQQVAAAAPYLRDGSGWTATERYRGALIQYGDQLMAQEDGCAAQNQYELALSIRADDTLQNKFIDAQNLCSPPTATPAPVTETPTPTWTPTVTATGIPSTTSVPSETVSPSPTTETPSPTTELPSPTAIPQTPTPTQPAATTQPPTNTPATESPTATPEPATATSEANDQADPTSTTAVLSPTQAATLSPAPTEDTTASGAQTPSPTTTDPS